jgi:LAGLIDADG DNA endonuclease family
VQQQIIVGTLLGDGTMRCKTNALLEVNHCLAQRSYVDWKYRQLAPLVRTSPRERAGNGGRIAYRFVTRSHAALTPYYYLFYRDGRKEVPDVYLSPLTLAVWFMDDGSRSRGAVYFNTQQFSDDCQLRLVRKLWNQWNIQASLNKDRVYKRIRLSLKGTEIFVRLVDGLVLPSMRYKLPQVTP